MKFRRIPALTVILDHQSGFDGTRLSGKITLDAFVIQKMGYMDFYLHMRGGKYDTEVFDSREKALIALLRETYLTLRSELEGEGK